MATFDGDPDHPVLDNPFSWELLEFTFRRDPADEWRTYVDMVFARNGQTRRLRFHNPRQFEWVPCGAPNSHGLCILDVSGRQMEGVGVRVANFEQSYGAPTFWAESVEVVDEADHTG